MFSLLRSSHHFHPELHGNFSFFLLSATIYWTNFIPEHSACFKFLSFRRACMLLYVRKSQRTSPQANRNEKLVPNVSFPTEPPPCLTVGTVHFGSNSSRGVLQAITLPSEPKRLNFYSSDQITPSQKLDSFSNISLANLSLFPRLILFT